MPAIVVVTFGIFDALPEGGINRSCAQFFGHFTADPVKAEDIHKSFEIDMASQGQKEVFKGKSWLRNMPD